MFKTNTLLNIFLIAVKNEVAEFIEFFKWMPTMQKVTVFLDKVLMSYTGLTLEQLGKKTIKGIFLSVIR